MADDRRRDHVDVVTARFGRQSQRAVDGLGPFDRTDEGGNDDHGLGWLKTPWVSFPGEYSARCESSGNATWLQVTHVGSHDRRPPLAESGDAALGLHLLDVNIALGNLVRLVRDQAAAFAR